MLNRIIPFLPETASATIEIDGVTYRPPLIDSDGHIQVDVLTSALPSGAATSAKQDTMITALQLIDDLRGALAAVAGDQLRTDVISSALPSGAASSAKQNTIITAVQKIDDLQNALAAVATDQLRTDVISSALPSGAASSAKQDTMITALQLIDDLRGALDAVQSDRLNINAYRDGASEIKSVRKTTISDSTNRATVFTPTSGKKIRLVSIQVMTATATETLMEIYFGTGTTIATNAGKEVINVGMVPDVLRNFAMVWPDGGGPLGATNDVLSVRTSANISTAGYILSQYREE